jgi:gamma-glutamyltranspeptidase/glutathione hydrolase
VSNDRSPTANASAGANSFAAAGRPTLLGTNGVVSTGHYLATSAGIEMLLRGGNAVDAGVAAGLCLNVVHNDMNTLSGVAPIVIHSAKGGRAITVAGIGGWPAAASRRHFEEVRRGIPDDLERCVVPAAAASWMRALERYGTLSFGEVSEPARRYAREGFPVHTFMHHAIGKYLHNYRKWPENRRLFLVDGAPPPVGRNIRQPDLNTTLEKLVAAERAGGSSREERMRAVTDRFYRGDVAERMVAFSRENGGLLALEDLSAYEVQEEPEVRIDLHGWASGNWSVAACGPWSQGPALPFALNVLRHFALSEMGHNSADYVNVVTSALDLAFADRNAFCGDPRFVDVPLEPLLAEEYGRARASLVDPKRGFSEPCPPGDPYGMRPKLPDRLFGKEDFGAPAPFPPADTSCVTAVDRDGNFFAATPSDGYCNGPIIPGLGLHISERGSQSFLDPADPNVVEAGKRPRLTPNPVLVYRDGEPLFAMATPGNDRQVQAMLQVLLNIAVFGMSPQEAVEAPRFASYNFRASTWPGNVEPGRLCLEEGIGDSAARALVERGRNVMRWPRWCWSAGGVCLSGRDAEGLFMGAADPRRESYALTF